MFNQLLTPVGDSLFLSFLVATIPIIVVLVMLGVLRRPAWQAALAGLAVALVIAIGVWQMPVNLAVSSTAAGVAFAIFLTFTAYPAFKRSPRDYIPAIDWAFAAIGASALAFFAKSMAFVPSFNGPA